jgi:hypothetical protein
LGAKGVGEASTIGSAPAIVSGRRCARAVGVDHIDMMLRQALRIMQGGRR